MAPFRSVTLLRDRIAATLKQSYDTHADWPFSTVDDMLAEWMADAVVDLLIDMSYPFPPNEEES